VSDPRDDDALSWGDDDPTLDVGAGPADESARRSARPRLPEGYRAVGKGSDEVSDTDAGGAATEGRAGPAPGSQAPDTERAQLGNAALIAFGVLGGVYLLYTLGWFIGGLRLQDVAPLLLVSPVAYVPAFWLAVLAPAIWFTVTLVLTRHSATWLRFVWLAAGALLLVPWPFIMIGAVGQ
jgi:hypothetical protein